MKQTDKRYKKSKALSIFQEDIDNIYNSILSITYYNNLAGYVYSIKDRLELNKNIDNQLFESLFNFQKKSFIFNNLYVSLVASMETFLQDRLVEELKDNDQKINNFISKCEINRKLTINDVIEGPKSIINELISSAIYHNLKRINVFYMIAFDKSIVELLDGNKIWTIIDIRHKIVHRTGRIGDKRIKVHELGLLSALTIINRWIENIDYKLVTGLEKKQFPNYERRFSLKMQDLYDNSVVMNGLDTLLSNTVDWNNANTGIINIIN